MEPLDIATLCVTFLTFVGVLLIHVRRRSSTAFSTDSCDLETSGSMNGNVVADHEEQDSLLPKFAGLLLSPWPSVTTGQNDEPKMTRPRSISLTMALPIGKKKTMKTAEVPIKKVHVPYFFPLLDETAEWWQMHQSTVAETLQTTEQEIGVGLKDDFVSLNRKEEMQILELVAKESL